MENPNTWTQLHYDLNDIIDRCLLEPYEGFHWKITDLLTVKSSLVSNVVLSLTECLIRHGYANVNEDDVKKEIEKYIEWWNAGEAGNSLPSRLVFMAKSLQNV